MFIQKLAAIMLRWIYIFLGISLIIIPYALVYMWYIYKWWDTDFFGGLILFIIEIFLLTLPILLVDMLVFWFLFKTNLRNSTLLKIGFWAWIILVIIMLLMKDL